MPFNSRHLVLPLACLFFNASGVFAQQSVEQSTNVRSLLGKRLVIPEFDDERNKKLNEQLRQANENLRENPESVENWIWVGRRLAYLWRYNESIEHYAQAIESSPAKQNSIGIVDIASLPYVNLTTRLRIWKKQPS